MSGVGQLEPFDLNHPNKWTTYKQRFELYLLANDVTEEARKKAALLTLAGAPLFELLTSLASPTQVSDLSLSEIYEILNQHLSPCQSEIAAYYQFHKRDQLIDESVANYMAALRTLAVDCKFGAALDRMLRDRFVCGMKDEGLQKSLLAEADLTIQRAMERATSSEAAAHSAWAMRNTAESTESIHEVQTNAIRPSRPNQHHQPCDGCGGAHLRKLCPHRNTVCHACHRAGHLQRVCRAVRDPGRKAFNTSSGHDSYRGPHKQKPNEEYSVHSILPLICPKEIVTIIINKRKCQFEVDSGSAITMIDEATFRYIWPTDRPNIQDCALEFTDYQKNRIPVIGIVDTSVQYDNKYIPNLPLVVTSSGGSNLLGRNWFMPLGISIEGIHAINAKLSIEATLAKYKDLFSSELGRFRGPPVSLQINTDATPVRLPARRIPFAIQELYEEELDRLCSQGILVPIEYSDWATPTVPVIKKDGTIRICGDYKSTINKVIKQHGYQIPPMNSLLASVEGGSIFAKIDLAQAYQQLVVDEQSALMQTISPGIFQSCIERILQNVSGVLPYFDDIIVMGKSEEELAVRLNEVLSRFDKAGLRLRRDKCQFGVPSVEFLGFKIDALGIRPCAKFVAENRVEHILTTTGVARGYGQIERVNRSILAVISKLSAEESSKWYKYVPQVQKALNSQVHASTKVSPFELMFGTKMCAQAGDRVLCLINEEFINNFNAERESLRDEAKKNILEAQMTYKRNFDKGRKQYHGYLLGDLVAIKRTQFVAGRKLASCSLGPYEVTKIKRNGRYDVRKAAQVEGPNQTSTSSDNMKLWRYVVDNDDPKSSGTDDDNQDCRM
ncbi:uncharacterized protein [Drosophila tropicalis]|uniref:uncharacterized protein n=1 Tax=Drosophila tropicalis TaxID=46794 RepID=UPI0035AB7EB8